MKDIVGSELVLEITDIALPNNYGVSRTENFVIFVPEAVPGDRVRVKVLREDRRYAYAQVIDLEKPSPHRDRPVCPHFDLCGGCALQDLVYHKQLEVKENYLLETMRRVGRLDLGDVEVAPITPSPDTYFYRNKLELAFGEKDGNPILGLRERVSPFRKYTGQILPLSQCLIFSPVLAGIIPVFLEFAKASKHGTQDPHRGKGFLKYLIVREGKSTEEIMVILETEPGDLLGLGMLWKVLTEEVPTVKSLYRAITSMEHHGAPHVQEQHLYGKPYIEDVLGGFTFRIYPRSFFQPNPAAAALLYKMIFESTRSRKAEKVLGIYSGMGPIEMLLSRIAGTVTGIDSLPENIANARENCRINNIRNCAFYKGKAEHILEKFGSEKWDCVVIDPPRSGISRKVLESITAIRPDSIAYVSCSPPTLARDLQRVCQEHYTVAKIMPFDFFPHTGHIETLVFLSRE